MPNPKGRSGARPAGSRHAVCPDCIALLKPQHDLPIRDKKGRFRRTLCCLCDSPNAIRYTTDPYDDFHPAGTLWAASHTRL